jgi:ubiquitin carboxyl-terminal hydrolase 14
MSTEAAIKVKWGKEVIDVTIDLEQPGLVLKAQLQSLTNVPVDRQKIMGATIEDEKPLNKSGITNGKTLMLVGSADPALVADAAAAKQKFTEDKGGPTAHTGTPRGIVNMGNTCYLNSSLQVLRQVPEIGRIGAAGPAHSVAPQLHKLMRDLDMGNSKPLTPFAFLTSFISNYPQFGEADAQGRPMQQDAQEAFSSILQSVQGACQAHSPEEAEAFKKLFTVRCDETLTCGETDAEAPIKSTSEMLMLPCNIEADTLTIENGVQHSLEGSLVKASTVLGRDATWRRQLKVSYLPEYLVVHLARFNWRRDTSQKAKILKPVNFPFVLDMYMYCNDGLKKALDPEREKIKQLRDTLAHQKKAAKGAGKDESSPAESAPALPPVPLSEMGNRTGYYELCGVVSHKGRTGDGGHYVAWVKERGLWMVADDENSAVVSDDDVARLKGVGEAHIAYVLLYRSRDPVTQQLAMPL